MRREIKGSIMGKMEDLKALYDAYVVDERFQHLRDIGRKFVPGAGPLKPSVMLIGEAPGKMENAKGIPFVGRAGVILDNILTDVRIDSDDVFQTNSIKYQPAPVSQGPGLPPRFPPTEEEIEASREYILEEIEIVEPIVIGLCGRTAIHLVFPNVENVYSHHGELIKGKFVPLYHPAVIGYNPLRKIIVREGYTKLKAYLDAKKAA
jgi:DNA polymerase